jgi:hypothetical protein
MQVDTIITVLEKRRDAIDQAIRALQQQPPADPPKKPVEQARAAGFHSPEGIERLRRAMKERWAAKRAVTSTKKTKRR